MPKYLKITNNPVEKRMLKNKKINYSKFLVNSSKTSSFPGFKFQICIPSAFAAVVFSSVSSIKSVSSAIKLLVFKTNL